MACQLLEFLDRTSSHGRITSTVALGKFNQQVRTFHDDTATRVFCCRLAEVTEESGLVESVSKWLLIVD